MFNALRRESRTGNSLCRVFSTLPRPLRIQCHYITFLSSCQDRGHGSHYGASQGPAQDRDALVCARARAIADGNHHCHSECAPLLAADHARVGVARSRTRRPVGAHRGGWLIAPQLSYPYRPPSLKRGKGRSPLSLLAQIWHEERRGRIGQHHQHGDGEPGKTLHLYCGAQACLFCALPSLAQSL